MTRPGDNAPFCRPTFSRRVECADAPKRWRVATPTPAEVHDRQWWWSKPADGVPHVLQLDRDPGNGLIFDPSDWPGEWAPMHDAR